MYTVSIYTILHSVISSKGTALHSNACISWDKMSQGSVLFGIQKYSHIIIIFLIVMIS